MQPSVTSLRRLANMSNSARLAYIKMPRYENTDGFSECIVTIGNWDVFTVTEKYTPLLN